MAQRALADSRRWMEEGTSLFFGALARVSDDRLAGPASLEGWTGKHLLAHVAANADALLNLVAWARTGEETPMYSSPTQRNADIEAGSQKPAGELRQWAEEAADRLAKGLSELTAEQWAREVRTAQGRTVPATEVPWMRAREVMVHAVDLDASVGFQDLPADFLASLVDDIAGKRSAGGDGPALVLASDDSDHAWTVLGTGDPTTVTGPLAGLTAYLAGRGSSDVATDGGGPAPDLPPWL